MMGGVTSGMIRLLFFTLLTTVHGGLKPRCPTGDYANDAGVCCNKCLAGSKLKAQCQAEGHRSVCEECPAGQYSEQPNYSSTCQACRTCRPAKNEVELIKCSSTKNAVCRCMDGFYKVKINSNDNDCVACKQCGENEEQKQACTSDRNVVCACKAGFYRVNKKCEICDSCRAECPHLCTQLLRSTTDPPKHDVHIITNICLAVLVVAAAAVAVLVTYNVTKSTLKKSRSAESPEDPPESCPEKKLLVDKVADDLQQTVELQVVSRTEETGSMSTQEAVPLRPEPGQPTSNLPDCVPLEVKTHELIYVVLDMVPVSSMKQLVRLLGVSEIEIEQAEVDCRRCRDAHYQMLKIWSQSGFVVGRGCQVLNRQLLQDLIRTLRQIHLVAAAQALEAKYGVQ